jgi:hypothetical protein
MPLSPMRESAVQNFMGRAWDGSIQTDLHRAETSTNGNWRFTFTFQDGHAYVLDYEDYH